MKPRKKKLKTYEISGVITYAHCYSLEVEATSEAEARMLARDKIDTLIDPASAEYQEYIMDKPILIKD